MIGTVLTCLVPLVIVVETQRPVSKQVVGYAAAVDAIVSEGGGTTGGESIEVLVASGPHGEGSVITAAAFRPDAPLRIHRSTKVLVDTDWVGREPRPRAAPGAETWELVRRLGIDWILLEAVPGQPQVELLEQSLPGTADRTQHVIELKGGTSRRLSRLRVSDQPKPGSG